MTTKQIFLQQTDNFINELCTICPKNTEILLFREKYNMVRSVNSTLIIEYFVQYVFPFKPMIMNEEDKFFLDGGGQEELKDKSGLKMRDRLKTLWISEISDENKTIIWKYFKIFILLCEKYIIENMNK